MAEAEGTYRARMVICDSVGFMTWLVCNAPALFDAVEAAQEDPADS